MMTATPRTTPIEKKLIFFFRISQLFRPIQFLYRCKNCLQLTAKTKFSIPKRNMENWLSLSTFSKGRRIWSFHVVVLKRMARKYIKMYSHVHSHCSAH